jgi:hypothetical protein
MAIHLLKKGLTLSYIYMLLQICFSIKSANLLHNKSHAPWCDKRRRSIPHIVCRRYHSLSNRYFVNCYTIIIISENKNFYEFPSLDKKYRNIY